MSTSVSRFITKDTQVEVLYVNPDDTDEMKWFCGIVKKAKHGEDEEGRYAECDILYEDGERIYDQRLYDHDFGDGDPDADSDECWKFSSPLSELIKNLRNEIKTLQECDDDDEDCTDDDDVEEEGYESNNDCVVHTKPARPNILVNISLITILSLAIFKLCKIGCENDYLPLSFCEAVV
jgi:hypothetical protein